MSSLTTAKALAARNVIRHENFDQESWSFPEFQKPFPYSETPQTLLLRRVFAFQKFPYHWTHSFRLSSSVRFRADPSSGDDDWIVMLSPFFFPIWSGLVLVPPGQRKINAQRTSDNRAPHRTTAPHRLFEPNRLVDLLAFNFHTIRLNIIITSVRWEKRLPRGKLILKIVTEIYSHVSGVDVKDAIYR